MADPQSENSFLAALTKVIEDNVANDQFGVSELADQMSMSRSNLLRKVKKESKLSVSQLINQVRLKRAMELLRKTSQNVSEVGHAVGFNSTSYFIKCFKAYYGYSPGEVGKRQTAVESGGVLPESNVDPGVRSKRIRWISASVAGALIIAVILLMFSSRVPLQAGEKSIAVLPFKNDSNDSSNIYLINGLMESTLNKLQQIQNIRVVSRTSVEKYRNTARSIPEMARELNVQYFVEGSGQKVGDRIVLNIQLIDGLSDKHLWSKQYRRKSQDIFELQEEIARNISEEVEVFITPEERSRIEKKPTDDPVAYDYFLKGKDLFYRSSKGDLDASIPFFQKAIEHDPEFSLAYASMAMVYYYLDIFSLTKRHTADIDNSAEKAMLYDPRSSESMIAKALSFAQKSQYELAAPYLEKALEFDPHSGLVLHFLTEFYNIHIPNPPKYLEFAIRKVQIDKATDSVTAGFNYFHLSNALLQNGFLEDALRYNEKSLRLDPKNFFTGFVNDYIHYAIDHDAAKVRDRLTARWKKDTMRFDILHEIGKASTMVGDYHTAASCYDRSTAMMKMFGLDLFKHEYLRMAIAYDRDGQKAKADDYKRKFKDFAEHNGTMYKDAYLSGYYDYDGDAKKAIEYFKRFADVQDNFIYWIVLMRTDPTVCDIKKDPQFGAIAKTIEQKFWKKHDELKERWGEELKNL